MGVLPEEVDTSAVMGPSASSIIKISPPDGSRRMVRWGIAIPSGDSGLEGVAMDPNGIFDFLLAVLTWAQFRDTMGPGISSKASH